MEILRLENATSLSASFSVPTASSFYTLELDDLITGTSYSASTTSTSGSVAIFALPNHYLSYTGSLAASVKNQDSDIVNMTNIDIIRPYSNPSSLASVFSIKVSEAIEYEKLARYIIDSHTGGFNFIRKEKEFIGPGYDQLLIDEPIYKLYKIYENGELLYDVDSETNESNYKINRQLNSIILDIPESNRMNYKKVWRDRFLDTDFYEGYEYLVDADYGWKVIPEDIKEASAILVQDIVEDNLKYVNKYIESFDNDDFKIKFVKNFSAGTGNKIVDIILEKYQKTIRVGVL